MIAWTRMIRAIKYSALILVAAFVGAYLASVHYSQKETKIVIQFEDDFQYFPDVIPHFSKDMLDEDFESCFLESFVTEVNATSLESISAANYSNYEDFHAAGADKKIIKHSRISVLKEFSDLMSDLNIKAVLIEPSIIFCMLSPFYKRLLLKRKIEPEKYFKSKKVVTFGIREKYIPLLEKTEVQTRISDANFSIEVARDPSPTWMEESGNFTNHMFFRRESFTVHVVFFHKRGSYLWHGGIKNDVGPRRKSLHFADSDSAYDSFIPVRPGFQTTSFTNIHIPSDPSHFLFQMPTSVFLECDAEVADRFLQASSSASEAEEPPSPLSQHRFRAKTVAALRALKMKLNPLLMRFWMWSGTMLGWYRQCDLIPYTSDVDFGAWAEEVDDLNTLLQLFQDDDHLKLKERMGVVQQGLEFNLNCHRLRVDLFFLYTESNGTWYAGHRPSKKYFFKYHHPNFSLCSADLLGQKVLVPCETEKVIRMEYGPNWLQPVSSWNYEISIFNRGPNIYWNESMLKDVYVEE